MKKVALVSFQDDADVSAGVAQLVEKYPEHIFFLPIIVEETIFVKSALRTLKEKNAKVQLFLSEIASLDKDYYPNHSSITQVTICTDPIKEVIRSLFIDDVLGMVWDDSSQAHVILHSVEDFGLETWNIADGLDEIEVDYTQETPEMLFDVVIDKANELAEALAEYVTTTVLDVLSETIAARIKEDEDKKEIPPFDED